MPVEFKLHMNLNIDKLTALTKERITDALGEIGAIVEGDAKRLCPVDRGQLRASIHHKLEKWNVLRIGTSQVTYGAPVEFGSMPHTPPFEPIRAWAKRHGIEEAAWAIWQKIRMEGTPAQPYLRPAIFNNQKIIARILMNAMREAAAATKK